MEIRSSSPLAYIKRAITRWKNYSKFGKLLWLQTLRVRGCWNLWRYSDQSAIIKLYQEYSGFTPNISNPARFSEKLQWLKLNNRDPIQTILADKIAVRAYLSEKGYDHILCKKIAYIDDAQAIDFDLLPDSFVMKASHSSGWNLICPNKAVLDQKHARRLVALWLKQSIFWSGREWPYKNMPRRVIIEEYLEDSSGSLRDYKFYCFNGVPRFIQANSGRLLADHAQNFYDLDWKILPFGKDLNPRPDIEIPRPAALEKMTNIARDLSTDHPYVRVDLYDVNGQVVFGELTFYPASGLPDFIPDTQDLICGKMLKLPNM